MLVSVGLVNFIVLDLRYLVLVRDQQCRLLVYVVRENCCICVGMFVCLA